MKQTTVVVVGCGGMGAGHANLLAKMPECKVVAVCDKNLALAQKVADGIGCGAGDDFAALLAKHKPDAASVCTDNRSHAPLAKITTLFSCAGVFAIVIFRSIENLPLCE